MEVIGFFETAEHQLFKCQMFPALAATYKLENPNCHKKGFALPLKNQAPSGRTADAARQPLTD